ncbi:hypothetical protein ACTXT7_015201 [Hymenolepis weldensis]
MKRKSSELTNRASIWWLRLRLNVIVIFAIRQGELSCVVLALRTSSERGRKSTAHAFVPNSSVDWLRHSNRTAATIGQKGRERLEWTHENPRVRRELERLLRVVYWQGLYPRSLEFLMESCEQTLPASCFRESVIIK